MRCRTCDAAIGEPFLGLGSVPASGALLSEEQRHQPESQRPLDAFVCPSCWLVQIEHFGTGDRATTPDRGSPAPGPDPGPDHCRTAAQPLMERFRLGPGALVVEVSSGGGSLLQQFQGLGMSVLGIEPAAAGAAIARGVPTDVAGFGAAYARAMAAGGKAADLIIGNNVLARDPEVNDLAEGLRIAIKPRGIVALEFPHLLPLVRNNRFDSIDPRQCSYFSLYAAEYLLHRHGLTVFDVEEVPAHGGSLRIYARNHEDQSHPVTARVQALRNAELQAGLLQAPTYRDFQQRAHEAKRDLLRFLIEAKSEGKRVAGCGGPARGSTLLCYCGIRTDFIDYTVDRRPHAQGKYLPGSQVPVRAPEFVLEDRPDYLLILTRDGTGEIMEQLSGIRAWGGKFVVPIPKLEVL